MWRAPLRPPTTPSMFLARSPLSLAPPTPPLPLQDQTAKAPPLPEPTTAPTSTAPVVPQPRPVSGADGPRSMCSGLVPPLQPPHPTTPPQRVNRRVLARLKTAPLRASSGSWLFPSTGPAWLMTARPPPAPRPLHRPTPRVMLQPIDCARVCGVCLRRFWNVVEVCEPRATAH
jgi:hypothetical protein